MVFTSLHGVTFPLQFVLLATKCPFVSARNGDEIKMFFCNDDSKEQVELLLRVRIIFAVIDSRVPKTGMHAICEAFNLNSVIAR